MTGARRRCSRHTDAAFVYADERDATFNCIRCAACAALIDHGTGCQRAIECGLNVADDQHAREDDGQQGRHESTPPG